MSFRSKMSDTDTYYDPLVSRIKHLSVSRLEISKLIVLLVPCIEQSSKLNHLAG